MATDRPLNCLACTTGEHICLYCSCSFCIDHLHHHSPCTPRRNALTDLRFAIAEAKIAELAATRMRQRLQDCLAQLEQLEP